MTRGGADGQPGHQAREGILIGEDRAGQKYESPEEDEEGGTEGEVWPEDILVRWV